MRLKEEELTRLDPHNMAGKLKLRLSAGRLSTDAMIKNQSTIIKNKIQNAGKNTEIIKASLDALSPKNIMSKGYSVITHQDGRMVGSVSELETDDEIGITMKDGNLNALVKSIRRS